MGFSIIPLNCPHCGADLDVPEGIDRVTCRFCNSQLQLVDTGSVAALKVVEAGLKRIENQTQRAAQGVDSLVQHQHGAKARWQEKMDDLERVLNSAIYQRQKHQNQCMTTIVVGILLFGGICIYSAKTGQAKAVVTVGVVSLPLVAILLALMYASARKGHNTKIADIQHEIDLWKLREPV